MKFAYIFLIFFSVLVSGQRSDFEQVNFKKADSIAEHYKGESLKNLPVLTHKLTANLQTDVEKFRAVYTWVSTNIENDYGAYLTTRKKRKKLANDREAFLEWNTSFTPKVFEKLIADRKTACTGYAYLIREMATLLDLNCKIVNGYGRTPTLMLDNKSAPNHSWNIIELGGKWYLCDATWSSGRVILEEDGPQFQSAYHDGYFLADPMLFIKNHYPLEINASLLPKPPSFTDFIAGPIVYNGAFSYSLIPQLPQKMYHEVLKNETILFSIKVLKGFQSDKIFLVLNKGGSDKIVQPVIMRTQNGYTLQYAFDKTGLYDVHIQMEEELIATYVLSVKRKKSR